MFLTLSLEFLLAADIAATAISPSWEAVGKLAAISGIRTFLNFFPTARSSRIRKAKISSYIALVIGNS